MTRRFLIPALAALLAGAVGCGRSNRTSVQLTELCFNPTPTTEGCAFPTGTCDKTNADGFLAVDLSLTGGTLRSPIQIDNQREDNSDTSTGRTNTNSATIERFDMRYEAPGVNLSASSSQTKTVPTSGSTVVVVVLIPSTAGAALAAAIGGGPVDMVIHVKAHGRYGDDTEFDTAEYDVPVTVSSGTASAFTCTDATKKPACCPQDGQTASCACL